jgi:hypothetical protein
VLADIAERRRLGRARHPVLQIFDLDEPDFAEYVALRHSTYAAHERIGGVVVGEREDAVRLCQPRLFSSSFR